MTINSCHPTSTVAMPQNERSKLGKTTSVQVSPPAILTSQFQNGTACVSKPTLLSTSCAHHDDTPNCQRMPACTAISTSIGPPSPHPEPKSSPMKRHNNEQATRPMDNMDSTSAHQCTTTAAIRYTYQQPAVSATA